MMRRYLYHTMAKLLPITVLFCMASLGYCESLYAQKLFLLTLHDPDVNGAIKDVQTIQGIAEAWTGFEKKQWTTKQSAPSILQSIQSLPVRKETDVVFFYYAGHGATNESGEHYFSSFPENRELTRKQVLDAMKALNPKLVILLTDCCAVYDDQFLSGVPHSSPDTEAATRIKNNLSRLFFAEGVVNINGASKGEVSLGTTDLGGGFFTSSLRQSLGQKDFQDWRSFIGDVSQRTNKKYTEFKSQAINGKRQLGKEEKDILNKQKSQTVWIVDPLPTAKSGDKKTSASSKPDPKKEASSTASSKRDVGVLIYSVYGNSTATQMRMPDGQEVELELGDRIISINGERIKNAKHFSDIVDKLPKSAAIKIVCRDHKTGKDFELTGRLDIGRKKRFGIAVTD